MASPDDATKENASGPRQAGETRPGAYKYEAFISYSHAADGQLAPYIERRLRRFAKSFWQSSMPVFRDETTLALTPHLWPTIRERIDQSRAFILLASPEAAASRWVEQEVSYWLEKRGADHLYIVLTSGTIGWDQQAGDFDWASTNSLPHALKRAFAFEPKWESALALTSKKDLSARNPLLEKIVASLYSAITGLPLEEVIGEDVQRRRTSRAIATVAASLAVVAAVTLGYLAVDRRAKYLETRQLEAIALANTWLRQSDPIAAAGSIMDAVEREPKIANEELRFVLLRALHSAQESAILQHDAALGYLSLSRDDQHLATASARVLTIWDAREQVAPTSIENPAELISMELSPDGRWMLTAGKDKVVRLWDWRVDSRAESRRLVREAEPKVAVFDRDATRVAILGKNGVACIWRLAETPQACAISIETTASKLTHISWSPDGTALVGVLADGSLGLWSADTGQQSAHIDLGGPAVSFDWEIAVDSRGARAVTWATRQIDKPESEREAGALWDLDQRRLIRRLEVEAPRWIAGAAFSPDGRRLALRTRNRALVINAESGETNTHLVGHSGYIRDLRFSPDGAWIATVSWDRSVRVWDAGTGQNLQVLNGHSDRVHQVAFRQDGCQLISVSEDRTARFWSLAAGAWHQRLSESPCEGGPRKAVRSAAIRMNSASFNQKGTLLATASTDRRARIWDLVKGTRSQLLPQQSQNVLATAFSPDERLLAVGEGSTQRSRTPSEVRLYDWRNGTELAKLQVEGRARSVQFSPDGRFLLAAIGDGNAVILRVDNTDQLTLHKTLPHGREPVTSASWSADGRRVATASTDHQVCVFALPPEEDNRQSERNCRKLAHDVFDVAWSHRGEKLAAVDGDANVHVWSSGRFDGEKKFKLLDDRYGVDVDFTADDRQIVVRLDDGTILLRDIALGRDVYELRAAILTTGFAVSPDGQRLATTHGDGSVRVLPLTQSIEDLVGMVKAGLPRCLTGLQRQRYGTLTDALDNPAWCKDKWPDDKTTRVFRTRPRIP
jgi:WD40 repeat protein